jgi:HEAT repeat protein
MAEIISDIGYASPRYVEYLSQLLDWPYWEVRMKAAEALSKLRHPLLEATLRRLLVLRHDPQSRAVRVAANEALDKLLSLETCLEDDEEVM